MDVVISILMVVIRAYLAYSFFNWRERKRLEKSWKENIQRQSFLEKYKAANQSKAPEKENKWYVDEKGNVKREL